MPHKSPSKRAEYIRNYKLIKRYGITSEEWEALFDSQGRVCAICKSDHWKRSKYWHTDHCHVSGYVRGILCFDCNRSLGLMEDNLSSLAVYVEHAIHLLETIDDQDTIV